jgi:hypothetical protein
MRRLAVIDDLVRRGTRFASDGQVHRAGHLREYPGPQRVARHGADTYGVQRIPGCESI